MQVIAAVNLNVLEHHAITVLKEFAVTIPSFMQNNKAPCQKVKLNMGCLTDQRVEVMDWPAQSTDVNPAEDLWKTEWEKVIERNPIGAEHLKLKI